ncbi:hypothetical protein KUF57_21860 [Mycolicibacterium sp. PAM1]|nr:hypothetical protein [Mycolicibacterium sp. PAM1]
MARPETVWAPVPGSSRRAGGIRFSSLTATATKSPAVSTINVGRLSVCSRTFSTSTVATVLAASVMSGRPHSESRRARTSRITCRQSAPASSSTSARRRVHVGAATQRAAEVRSGCNRT